MLLFHRCRAFVELMILLCSVEREGICVGRVPEGREMRKRDEYTRKAGHRGIHQGLKVGGYRFGVDGGA